MDEPLSVVYNSFWSQGIIQSLTYVHCLTFHDTNMSKQRTYRCKYGHENDGCHDLYYKFLNLIDQGVISPTYKEVLAKKVLSHSKPQSKVDIFRKLVEQGQIHPLP